jgi:hypothetical protein
MPSPDEMAAALRKDERAAKSTAHYRMAANPDKRRCAVCTMFRAPSSCTSVRGEISPNADCDFFKHK